ncbi:hypothetical protein ACHAXT_012160 [Thalassiosira profunda]
MNLCQSLALSQLVLATAAAASASLRGAAPHRELHGAAPSLRGAANQQQQQQQRELENRIIGGAEAVVDRFNYAVSLQDSVAHFCGGSMLSPDIVLSAAHCAQNSPYNVIIHRHDLRSSEEEDGEVRRVSVKSNLLCHFCVNFFAMLTSFEQVVQQFRHPQYDPNTVNNDFMILQLNEATTEPVDFVKVSPEYVGGDQAVTVVGWGDTDPTDGRAMPPSLQETEVFTLTNEECRASEGEVGGTNLFGFTFGSSIEQYGDRITTNMICAKDDGEDSCQGDSGGPMVIKNEDGADMQVGVVSWGFGCAHNDFPGVYGRVSAQYGWIRETTCALSSDPPAYLDCPPSSAGVQATSEPTADTTDDEGWTTLLDEGFDIGLGLFARGENAAATYATTVEGRQGVVGIANGDTLLSNPLTFAPDGTNSLYRIRFSFIAMNMGTADDLCLNYVIDDGTVMGEKCWRGEDAFNNGVWTDDKSLVFSKPPNGASSLTMWFAVKGDSSEDKVLFDSVTILGQ